MIEPADSPAVEPFERIQCQWCQGMNEKAALACRACGAPLDIRNLISESGWREAPRIRDMTEIQFSSSSCQVEGEIVPVAEINLGPGDGDDLAFHLAGAGAELNLGHIANAGRFAPAGFTDQIPDIEGSSASAAGQRGLLVHALAPLALDSFERFDCGAVSGFDHSLGVYRRPHCARATAGFPRGQWSTM